MKIKTQSVELKVPDGTIMRAFTAVPQGTDPLSGLMVFPEAFGVNAHIRDVAERFAGQGYAVVAPELYHRTAPPGFECGYTDFNLAGPHLQAVTPEGIEADSRACWTWLDGQSRVRRGAIGCVGYCLGGRASFVANGALPFKAAVSYYGGRIAPGLLDRAPKLHAPMLFFWGGLDKHIPVEQRTAVAEALRQAGKPQIQVEISYADHGFFCDGRSAYQPAAAHEAWALTLAFLREKLA